MGGLFAGQKVVERVGRREGGEIAVPEDAGGAFEAEPGR